MKTQNLRANGNAKQAEDLQRNMRALSPVAPVPGPSLVLYVASESHREAAGREGHRP